jgi:hypothetical protein
VCFPVLSITRRGSTDEADGQGHRSGERSDWHFIYFDSKTHRVGAAHVMASSSLPPSFLATEIEGETSRSS